MTEKFKKDIDHEFNAHVHAINLTAMCRERDSKDTNTTDCGAEDCIKRDTLFKVLANETACTSFRLTPIGYLIAIWTIFKIAFIEKKFKSGITSVGVIFIK